MAHDRRHHEDEELPDVSHISNEDVAHEESDVKIRPIVWFLVWLSVATVVIMLLMSGLFSVLEKRVQSEQGEPSPMASEREVIPPEPRLQLAPTERTQGSPRFQQDHPLNDLKKLHEDERAKLEGYSVDQASGTARIPIKEAKELLLRSGALNKPAAGHSEQAAQGSSAKHARDNRPSRSSAGRLPENLSPAQQKTETKQH